MTWELPTVLLGRTQGGSPREEDRTGLGDHGAVFNAFSKGGFRQCITRNSLGNVLQDSQYDRCRISNDSGVIPKPPPKR